MKQILLCCSGCFTDASTVTLKPRPPEESNTSVLIGCLVTIILLLVVIIFLILWWQYVCKVLEKVRIVRVRERQSASVDVIHTITKQE